MTNSEKRWELKRLVHQKLDGKCAYCGYDIDLYDFHLDHFIPKRRYKERFQNVIVEHGSDGIHNLMPACSSCNSCKSDLTIEEFRERIMDRLNRVNLTSEYKIAKRFGLIKEMEVDSILFHFEKLNTNG